MNAAELLEQAQAEGVLLVLDDGRLTWEADREPPGELLEEVRAHRLEIIAVLSSAHEATQRAWDWLASVACLLDCSPAYLLDRGFIDQFDLEEQHTSEPACAAALIRSNPEWAGPGVVTPPVHADSPGEPHRFIHAAATASPEWIAVRNRYIGHLMTCRGCHAPFGSYCETGADLRDQYSATPWS